jgi:hypothetical protein
MNLLKFSFVTFIVACLSACKAPLDLYDTANPVQVEFKIITPDDNSTIIANNSDVKNIEVFEENHEGKYYMIIYMSDEATVRIQKSIEQNPNCILALVYDKHHFSPIEQQNLKKGTFRTLSVDDKESAVRKASGILSLNNHPEYKGSPNSVLEMMQQ